MKIEVTQKDLDALMNMIKIFGSCYFKEISGKQQLAHIRTLDEVVVIANKIAESLNKKEPEPPMLEEIKKQTKKTKNVSAK